MSKDSNALLTLAFRSLLPAPPTAVFKAHKKSFYLLATFQAPRDSNQTSQACLHTLSFACRTPWPGCCGHHADVEADTWSCSSCSFNRRNLLFRRCPESSAGPCEPLGPATTALCSVRGHRGCLALSALACRCRLPLKVVQ